RRQDRPMTTSVPGGVQRSEDGQWWWDDSSQQWQAVGSSGHQGSGRQQVDWTQYPTLQQLFTLRNLDDFLQVENVDPQILHIGAAEDVANELKQEYDNVLEP